MSVFEEDQAKTKLNESGRQPLQKRNPCQQAKNEKLCSDPLQALTERTSGFSAERTSGFSVRGLAYISASAVPHGWARRRVRRANTGYADSSLMPLLDPVRQFPPIRNEVDEHVFSLCVCMRACPQTMQNLLLQPGSQCSGSAHTHMYGLFPP